MRYREPKAELGHWSKQIWREARQASPGRRRAIARQLRDLAQTLDPRPRFMIWSDAQKELVPFEPAQWKGPSRGELGPNECVRGNQQP